MINMSLFVSPSLSLMFCVL